ncbi:wee1-like protein kinase, partial [Sesbania bispinosa]
MVALRAAAEGNDGGWAAFGRNGRVTTTYEGGGTAAMDARRTAGIVDNDGSCERRLAASGAVSASSLSGGSDCATWVRLIGELNAISVNPLSPTFSGDHQQVAELGKDSVAEEVAAEKTIAAGKPKAQNYVSHSAVALRCRIMPPPCIRNPYLKDASEKEIDPFGNQRSKCE